MPYCWVTGEELAPTDSPKMTAQTKAQTAATAAPLPLGAAGAVRTIQPARVPSGALAALLSMLPDDAPAGPSVREPKWYGQATQAGLTEGQRAFLARINWTGCIASDGEPEDYQPEARRDVKLPSAKKLRKMAKPGGLVSDAMIAAMSQKGSLSVVDCLAVYNSEKVKITSIGALLNRVGRVVGFAVSLQSDGNIVAQGTAPDGFYQATAEVEAVLRSLAAEALENQYAKREEKV